MQDEYHWNTQNTAEYHEVSSQLSVPQLPAEGAAFHGNKISTIENREHQCLRGGKMASVIYSLPKNKMNNATITQSINIRLHKECGLVVNHLPRSQDRWQKCWIFQVTV